MEPNIKGGCILLARKVIESEIWEKPPLYIKVWVFLLSSAQYKPYKNMQRGQVYTSIPEIIEGCKWRVGARVERPTKDQIYQIIEWLRKPNEGGNESNAKATMITTTKATHGMLINIDNYGFYQDFKNYESNDESNDEKATNPLRKQREPDNINKNLKKDKELQEVKKDIVAYADIVSHLNMRASTSYKATTKKTQDCIKARYNEGFTLDDFKTVIDKKCVEWVGSDMEKYLRPETLFGTKFESYLNQSSTSLSKGKSNYSKETKLDKNKELLLGGNNNARTRREVNTVESFGSLPEPNRINARDISSLD